MKAANPPTVPLRRAFSLKVRSLNGLTGFTLS